MKKAMILGTGAYVPKHVMTNDDLSNIVDTSDEWISTRTGIKKRHISTGETTSELGLEAARIAIKEAKVDPLEIDLIICATITPDSFMPATACVIQAKLEAKNAVAFDISAACSGLVVGMLIARQFIETGAYKKVLVIGSETLSRIIDWTDRSTCVLFGDGAGAILLGANENDDLSGILQTSMISTGNKGEFLTCPAIPLNNTLYKSEEVKAYMAMDGGEVFKFAVKSISTHIKEVVSKEGLTFDDIKYIVPHQANVRIISFAAKTLGIEEERFYLNLENYGNTSSASIGIALDELIRSGKVKKGDKLVLAGFGGGMTAGAILIQL